MAKILDMKVDYDYWNQFNFGLIGFNRILESEINILDESDANITIVNQTASKSYEVN
jgi:hypothetical protein